MQFIKFFWCKIEFATNDKFLKELIECRSQFTFPTRQRGRERISKNIYRCDHILHNVMRVNNFQWQHARLNIIFNFNNCHTRNLQQHGGFAEGNVNEVVMHKFETHKRKATKTIKHCFFHPPAPHFSTNIIDWSEYFVFITTWLCVSTMTIYDDDDYIATCSHSAVRAKPLFRISLTDSQQRCAMVVYVHRHTMNIILCIKICLPLTSRLSGELKPLFAGMLL